MWVKPHWTVHFQLHPQPSAARFVTADIIKWSRMSQLSPMIPEHHEKEQTATSSMDLWHSYVMIGSQNSLGQIM